MKNIPCAARLCLHKINSWHKKTSWVRPTATTTTTKNDLQAKKNGWKILKKTEYNETNENLDTRRAAKTSQRFWRRSWEASSSSRGNRNYYSILIIFTGVDGGRIVGNGEEKRWRWGAVCVAMTRAILGATFALMGWQLTVNFTVFELMSGH